MTVTSEYSGNPRGMSKYHIKYNLGSWEPMYSINKYKPIAYNTNIKNKHYLFPRIFLSNYPALQLGLFHLLEQHVNQENPSLDFDFLLY